MPPIRPRLRAVLAGSVSLAVLTSLPAHAQTVAPQDPTQNPVAPTPTQDPTDAVPTAADVATPADADAASNDEIVVTGSRIRRAELDSPNPVTSFSAASIEQSGRTNITDFLVQNPALLGSTTNNFSGGSNAAFGGAGLNLLNLRNLGSARTLVLVDGRRHVAGLPGSASVDINTIPKDLIDRVDVQTGGASAVYGADAVSGAVNFVLKRDFEGLRIRGQAGSSTQGDAGNRFVSVTGGKNFAEGRGNVALSYEFTQDDRVRATERGRTGNPLEVFSFQQNQADLGTPDDPNLPDRILYNNLRYLDSSRAGAVDIDFDGVPEFNGTGLVYDRGLVLSRTGLAQGGDSTPVAGYGGDLQPLNRIHNVNLLTSFSFSPALRVFAQGKYTNTRTFTVAQPSFDFYTALEADNAYLNDLLGARAPDGALITRDNFDFGIRGESNKRETYRGVIGADGTIGEHGRYELSYVYGRTDSRFLSTNYRLTDRYLAAIDAVRAPNGQIVCRSNLDATAAPFQYDFGSVQFPGFNTFTPGANSGCQPLNILGDGSASRAALDFVNVDLVNNFRVQQHVLSGSIAGDFGRFFELPGGPVAFALGGEYRKEKSNFVSDPYLQQGALADIAQVLPSRGSFDVKEAFGELSAPLLRNARFAHLLEFGAALRLSDYSTVGNTTTWSVNGIYAPVPDLRIRGTYSQAVRAPNIDELFAPVNGTFSFINDPCDPQNLPEGTQFRAANCTALLTQAGLSPAQIAAFNPVNDPTATVSLPGRSGGNVNLSEETAKTWTAGFVLTPSFVRGLNVQADWYDIRLRNAVNTASAQQLVELCVDQPTTDNPFCSNITRSPRTGYVSDYLLAPQNVAQFRTAGLDVKVNYQFEVSPQIGSFNLRVVGNYLDRLSFVPTPGAEAENSRQLPFAPKYSGTFDLTWTKGPVTLNYGLNYFSKLRRFTVDQITANPDFAEDRYFFFRERWEHDLQGSIAVGDRFSLYGGVNNLTDKEGDVASFNTPYGFVGRTFYLGARVALDRLF